MLRHDPSLCCFDSLRRPEGKWPGELQNAHGLELFQKLRDVCPRDFLGNVIFLQNRIQNILRSLGLGQQIPDVAAKLSLEAALK